MKRAKKNTQSKGRALTRGDPRNGSSGRGGGGGGKEGNEAGRSGLGTGRGEETCKKCGEERGMGLITGLPCRGVEERKWGGYWRRKTTLPRRSAAGNGRKRWDWLLPFQGAQGRPSGMWPSDRRLASERSFPFSSQCRELSLLSSDRLGNWVLGRPRSFVITSHLPTILGQGPQGF